MAFYLLARSIEVIQLISDSPILESSSMSYEFINGLLDFIAYVIPDLYKFTKTDWLVYYANINDSVFIIIGQTVVYVVLLSCVALFDLYRKEL